MSLSATVIDLVSSDDEDDKNNTDKIDEIVCIVPPEAKKAPITTKRGTVSTNNEKDETSIQYKKAKKGMPKANQNHSMMHTHPESNPSDFAQNPAFSADNMPPVVFDDAGNDNAIITFGVLEVLSTMNISDCLLCIGRKKEANMGTDENNKSCPQSTICHIQQNDKWSCGFRNLQMLLAAIIPHMPASHSFFQTIPRRHPNPAIPSLRQLQSALESSWQAGFDPVGARHFKHKIVGRASKIGAVEVSSVLAYCGVDSTVVQFIKCSESRDMLPKFIQAYFSKSVGIDGCPFCSAETLGSDVCAKELLQIAGANIQMDAACDCPLFPLYLQWEGHSVSIVGIEKNNNILVLDPIKDGQKMKSDLQKGNLPSYLKISSKLLVKKDTQIVMCSFRSLAVHEKENRIEAPSVITAAEGAVEQAILRERRGGFR